VLIKLLGRFLRPYRGQVGVVVALLAGQTVANLYLPNLNADIINNGVVKGNLGYIWTTGGLMLGITLALGVVSIVAVYHASRVAMGVGADVRAAVFVHVQGFSAREMHRFGTPSLITRNTNDIQQVQIFVQAGLTLIVIAPIMSVGGVIMAVHESAALSPLLAVSVPVMLALIGVVLVAVVPQFRSMQGKIDRINQVLREQITGVRVIRAFVRTEAEGERFGEANAELTATALRINRIFALAFPSVMAMMNLSSVAVIWFGGLLVRALGVPHVPDRLEGFLARGLALAERGTQHQQRDLGPAAEMRQYLGHGPVRAVRLRAHLVRSQRLDKSGQPVVRMAQGGDASAGVGPHR